MTVTVSDWSEGFRKISFNDLLRHYGGYSLGEAKRAVDQLLDHRPLMIEIADEGAAKEFCHRAIGLGAVISLTAEIPLGAGENGVGSTCAEAT